MSSKSSQTNYALSTQILNELKNDGCILDPYKKVYDEEATAMGGTGDRLQFKRVNDEINKIQNVLKILTGDERVNITEEIPVVDFAHPENTGFDNIYVTDQNGNIDEHSIHTIGISTDEREPSSAMRHMENSEQIINRALLGERSFMGCHLWNSNSVGVDEFNIQVSPYIEYEGSYDYTYMGTYVNEGSGFSTSKTTVRPYRTDTLQLLEKETKADVTDILLFYGDNTDVVTCTCALYIPKGSSSQSSNTIIAFTRNSETQEWGDTPTVKTGFDSYAISGTTINIEYREAFPMGYMDMVKKYFTFLSTYINLERSYYSKASGLLNGLWSEPCEYTDMGNGYKVTKWKFSNDWIEAKNDGVTIPVGSHYYKGCLICDKRGNTYEKPMRTTNSNEVVTYNGQTYTGKATYIGSRFLINNMDELMKQYEIPMSTWGTRNSYTLTHIKYYDTYKNDASMQKGGVALRSDSGSFNFSSYFDAINEMKNGNTLTLDIKNTGVAYDYTKYNARGENIDEWGINAVGDRRNNVTWANGNYLSNTGDYVAYMNYIKILDPTGGSVMDNRHGEKLTINFKDPFNLLCSAESNLITILLYDAPNTHMPTSMWLVSRNNLGIEKYDGTEGKASLVTISTVGSSSANDKLAMFKCTDTKSFMGSEITQIKIKDDVDSNGFIVPLSHNDWIEYTYTYDLNYMPADGVWVTLSQVKPYLENNPQKLEKALYMYHKFHVNFSVLDVDDLLRVARNNDFNGMLKYMTYVGSSEDPSYKDGAKIYFDAVSGTNKIDVDVGVWDTIVGAVTGFSYDGVIKTYICDGIRNEHITPDDMLYNINKFKTASHNDGDEMEYTAGPLTVHLKYRSTSSTFRNVYAYKIEPFTLDTGISFWGQDNETITLKESSVISLSYPSTHLQFNPNDWTEENGYPYTNGPINPTILRGSSVIVGLPTVENLTDIRNLSNRVTVQGELAMRCETLYNLFHSDDSSAMGMWKGTLFNVFKDWRLSDGENPMRFENLLELIDGIDELRKTNLDVDSLNITVTTNGVSRKITNYDLDKLWRLLDSGDEVNTGVYDYTPSTAEISASDTLESLISAEEDTIAPQEVTCTRKSLLEIKRAVEPILDDKTVPTMETFIELDEIFGNSGAFLRIGNSVGVQEASNSIVSMEREIISKNVERYLTMSWNREHLGIATDGNPEDSMTEDELYEAVYGSEEDEGSEGTVLGDSWEKKIANWFTGALSQATSKAQKALRKADLKLIPSKRAMWVRENRIALLKTLTGAQTIIYNELLEAYATQRANALMIRKGYTSTGGYTPDIDMDVLKAIATYMRGRLEGDGVFMVGGEETYARGNGVRFIKGDKEPSGLDNGLYYKRYLYLNNRLNKTNGALNKASMFINNREALTSMDIANKNRNLAYMDYLDVMPVSRMTNLTYVPKQKAKFSDDMLFGHFYNTEVLDRIKAELGRNCMLTCTKCAVASNCIYYDHNLLLDKYLPSVNSIDFYVKDNKLDLIGYETAYNGQYTSPSLATLGDHGETLTFDPTILQDKHKQYNTIFNVDNTRKYDGIELSEVIEDLGDTLKGEGLSLDEEGIGWIIGGRYGTVRENVIKNYDNVKEGLEQTLPDKTVLYDAVFVEDEETYVNYTLSTHSYEVSLDYNGRHYEGMTRLMVPTGLKALDDAPDDADVYLVSDDTIVDGESLLPVIYLNTAYAVRRMIQFEIDYDDPYAEATIDDRHLHAKDIAQLAINVAKGNMKEHPIFSEGGEDMSGLDQIWMDTYEKKVHDEHGREAWIELEGRPREETHHSELLCNTDSFNRALLLSGKPLSASYINYLRKVSIPMLEEETENGTIRTIRWTKYGNEATVDKKKKTLQHMKTNLRLVVATYDK